MTTTPRLKAPRVPKYTMYVDEVGLYNAPDFNDFGRRYFSLTGVIMEKTTAEGVLEDLFHSLKDRCLVGHTKEDPIILHRYDIMRRHKRFECLQDEMTRFFFDTELMAIIKHCPMTVVTCVLDRKAHMEKYHAPADAYEWTLQMLMERFTRELDSRQEYGNVVIESRNPNENRALERAFGNFIDHGYNKSQWLSSRKPKFPSKKENIAALQLADLIAAPSARYVHCRQHNVEMTSPFGGQVAKILVESKYRRSPSGKIDGWGTKFFPS